LDEKTPAKHEYPSITVVDRDKTVRELPVRHTYMRRAFRVHLNRILGDVGKSADLALGLEQPGCVCVVLNSVSRSQEVYRRIRDTGFPGTLKLFHARFPAETRQELENECMRLFGKNPDHRPESAILVCTQVVEQSLDLDFDFMVTELAPIDLILQRLGRLHRHERIRPAAYPQPAAEVLLCDVNEYRNFLSIYDLQTLYRTERILENVLASSPELRTPEMMRELIEYVYFPGQRPEDEAVMHIEKDFSEKLQRASANMNSLPKPSSASPFFLNGHELTMNDDENAIFFAAKTRLAEPSLRVALVPADWIAAARKAPYDKETAERILMKSVSLRESLIPGLAEEFEGNKEGLLKGIPLLPSVHGSCAWANGVISYDEELGVLVGKK
jgi:CRISPR-associated endonuclease/helicase Cas3